MRALTLWQPWASLIALGEKRVETRCWKTIYRGELAIHSAAALPPKWLGASRHQSEFRTELADVFNTRRDEEDRCGPHVDDAIRKLPLGKVLCIVRLLEIIPASMVRDEVSQRDRIFGNYEEGLYAWFLELKEVFEEPIPAKRKPHALELEPCMTYREKFRRPFTLVRRCTSRDAARVLLNDLRRTQQHCHQAGRKAAQTLRKEAQSK